MATKRIYQLTASTSIAANDFLVIDQYQSLGVYSTKSVLASTSQVSFGTVNVLDSTIPANGLYLPAANSIGISTNSTNRVYIDSSGNIGVGVTPSAWSGVTAIQIGSQGSISTNGNLVQVRSNAYFNGSVDKYIASSTASDYYQNAGAHIWRSASSGTAGNTITFTEVMRIDSIGNVGIGTDSPASKLDVGGTLQAVRTVLSSITDTYHQYRGTPDGVGYEHARIYSGRDANVYNYGSYLAFYTEGKSSGITDTSTERLRIDSNGNVGVGTDNPSILAKLAVKINTPASDVNNSIIGGTDGTKSFQIAQTGSAYSYAGVGGNELWMYLNSSYSALTIGSDGAVPIKFVSNAAERMRIDLNGNVGVGLTPSSWDGAFSAIEGGTPSTGSTGQGSLIFQKNGDYTTGLLSNVYYNSGWKYKNSAAAGYYMLTKNIHSFGIAASGTAGDAITWTEAMRIDSSGYVGIGTQSPGCPLEVFSNSTSIPSVNLRYSATSLYSQHSMDGNGDYVIKSPAANGVTSGNLSLQCGSSLFVYTGNTFTAGSQKLIIDTTGNVGVGVTPSGLDTRFKNIELGYSSSLSDIVVSGTNILTYLQHNAYVDSSGTTKFKYSGGTNYASMYSQTGGNHIFHNSTTSGTAGDAVTFVERLRIDSNGNVGIGTGGSQSALLTIKGVTSDSNGIHLISSGWDYKFRIGANGTSGGEVYLSQNWNSENSTVDNLSYATNYIDLSTNGYVRIGTGVAGVSPTERLRIDSSGNVGIGTSVGSVGIDAKLHIKGGQTSDTKPLGLLKLQNIFTDGGVNRNTIGIEFFAGDTSSANVLMSGIYANTATGYDGTLRFFTSNSGSNYSEKMQIDSSGNVGVGTAPAAWKPEVRACEIGSAAFTGSIGSLYLDLANNAYFSSTGSKYKANGKATLYEQDVNGCHTWFNAASGTAGDAITFREVMRIDDGGNVGIATTNPSGGYSYSGYSRILGIGGSTTDSLVSCGILSMFCSRATPTAGDYLGSVSFASEKNTQPLKAQIISQLEGSGGVTGGFGGNIQFHTRADNSASLTERMRIDSNGNVGIGIVPSAWVSSSTRKAIQFPSIGQVASSGTMVLYSNSYYNGTNDVYTTTGGAGSYTIANNVHIWNYAASGTAGNTFNYAEAMRIDSNGNVGIGITPSAWGSGYNVIDINSYGSLTCPSSWIGVAANCYYDGSTWKYKNSSQASIYQQIEGRHIWYSVASGTAGNGFVFDKKMELNRYGLLSLDSTTGQKLDIYDDGNATPTKVGFGVDLLGGSYQSCAYVSSPSGGNGNFHWLQQNSTTGTYTELMEIDSKGNVYGTSGTTGMSDGFFYMPSAAGAPTGTPTSVAGHVPFYYDTTNNQFYVYNGAWKKVTLS